MDLLGSIRGLGSFYTKVAARKEIEGLHTHTNELQQQLTDVHERLRDSFAANSELRVVHTELQQKFIAQHTAYKAAAARVSQLEKALLATTAAHQKLVRQNTEMQTLLDALPPASGTGE
jgi:hypothetical protein